MQKQYDPHVLGFFQKLVAKKYQQAKSADELAKRSQEIYAMFSNFLLEQFRSRVSLSSEQSKQVKQMYAEGAAGRDQLMAFLTDIVTTNTDLDLDQLLVNILNDFVNMYYQEF